MKRRICLLMLLGTMISMAGCGAAGGGKEPDIQVKEGTPVYEDNAYIERGAYCMPAKADYLYPDSINGARDESRIGWDSNINEQEFRDYKDAGFTFMLTEYDADWEINQKFSESNLYTTMELAEKVGIPVVVHTGPLERFTSTDDFRISEENKQYMQNLVATLSTYEMFRGFSFKDEPKAEFAPTFKAYKDYLLTLKPDAMFFTSFHPIYGSAHCEVGNAKVGEGLYVQLCGPDYEHNHFLKTLKKGETFVSVPVAFGVADGGFDEVMGEMTKYRRNIRRKNADNEDLPVIFNDYMNCLFADPTTEKELPLIDAAAEAGAEYFVIDAGWFSELEGGDDSWWSSIGVWKESSWRFPNGLIEVMDYIRSKGMKPGIWIEIEGIGPDSEIGKTLPDDWFFQIQGKRNIEHYRWQLDFRNPEVRKFADDTLEEVVSKYDLKYLKIDYNINAGLGTDLNAESPGSGLLGHCRVYLEWLDAFLERHPDVVIENCASGGQRMDYAMLSRLSIQSTSDQTHYDLYPSISTMAPSVVTPEQAAVWSYPHFEADEEEAVFNMVNAMLGRVHQSGFLNQLPKANFERVKEGIACYKSIRQEIKDALPRFPLDLVGFDAPWAAAALDCDSHWYLSVWRKDGDNDTQEIPLVVPEGRSVKVECIYPKDLPVEYEYDAVKNVLRVTLNEKLRARFFKVEWH